MAKKRPNGDGSYHKRADGRWQGRVTLPGGLRRSFYGPTRGAVLDKVREAQRNAEMGLASLTREQTFATYLDQWLLDVAKPSVRPTTYESYEQIVRNRIKPDLGKVKLSALTPQQIQALYTKLAKTLKPASIVRTHAIIRASLKQAVLWNLIPRNAADAVRPPSIQRMELQYLNRDQVQQLVEAAHNETAAALYAVAATCGLRRGELLGLRWSDLNFDKGQLTVQRTAHRIKGEGFVFGEPKTQAGRRTIRVGAFALNALRKQRTRQNEQRLYAGPAWEDTGLIFTSGLGTPLEPARVTRRFQATLAAVGLPPVRFHDLRHTAATLLIEQGVAIKAVQATLGHSTIATTMDVYSHVTPTMQDSVAEAMDRLFGDPR